MASKYTDPSDFIQHIRGELIQEYLQKRHNLDFPVGDTEEKSEDGWDAVNQRLNLTGERASKLRIYDNCPHLIRAIPLAVPDGNNRKDISTVGETAALDDLRYVVQTIRDQKTPPPESSIERRLRKMREAENTFDYQYRR